MIDDEANPQWVTLIKWIEDEVEALDPPIDDPEYQAKALGAADLISLALDLIADAFHIHYGMSGPDWAALWDVQENHVATVMKLCKVTRERLFDFEVLELYAADESDVPEHAEKLKAYREFFDRLGALYTEYFVRFARFANDDAPVAAAAQ